MTLYALGDLRPKLPEDGACFVADSAALIGDVHLGRETSVWFGAVLRGDTEAIHVGHGSNVQDHTVIHTDPGFPVTIGENCTIGHRAIVHGCTIGDGCLIGMGATVLNGAVIGAGSLVGAGALVTEGTEVPPGSLVIGMPARVKAALDADRRTALLASAESYRTRMHRYLSELKAVR